MTVKCNIYFITSKQLMRKVSFINFEVISQKNVLTENHTNWQRYGKEVTNKI